MFAIVRETSFDEQVLHLCKTHHRINELDNAIDWALRRKPHKIPNVIKFPPNHFLWVTDEFYNSDIPMVRILYRIDFENNIVTLLSIQEVGVDEEDFFNNL